MNPMFSMPQEEHSKEERLRLSIFVYLLSAYEDKDTFSVDTILDEAVKVEKYVVGDDNVDGQQKFTGGQYI